MTAVEDSALSYSARSLISLLDGRQERRKREHRRGLEQCPLLASCGCAKRGNIGFHNLMKLRGEITTVDRSSNQCLEFITCKSLELEQSMKCQLALQHIQNNINHINNYNDDDDNESAVNTVHM